MIMANQNYKNNRPASRQYGIAIVEFVIVLPLVLFVTLGVAEMGNAIRQFVIGRKNWLFSTSVDGAKASANLYSLIETAKANGLEPYAYLKRLFTELPNVVGYDDVDKLLPEYINLKNIKNAVD